LHALTGWIPERVSIKSQSADFDSDSVFARLKDGLLSGRCLITVATGELSDEVADRAGLVSTHAYAVLDLKEINVRLMLLNLRRNKIKKNIKNNSYRVQNYCN